MCDRQKRGDGLVQVNQKELGKGMYEYAHGQCCREVNNELLLSCSWCKSREYLVQLSIETGKGKCCSTQYITWQNSLPQRSLETKDSTNVRKVSCFYGWCEHPQIDALE